MTTKKCLIYDRLQHNNRLSLRLEATKEDQDKTSSLKKLSFLNH